ncbi:unnamed protein product [Symbiodinium natans]|uniref:Uncharacterized protein n=1 Tax=Symbiodinium natans TaxID=878477 RepID=A0A812N0V1_9DINO|nr:unnamed protein product [Symbiodinium natans]
MVLTGIFITLLPLLAESTRCSYAPGDACLDGGILVRDEPAFECSFSTGTTTSTTSSLTTRTETSTTQTRSTTLTGYFDCAAAYDNRERAWSDAKKVWCCRRRQLGCPTTTSHTVTTSSMTTSTDTSVTSTSSTSTGTRTTTTEVTVTHFAFDCSVALNNWEKEWSEMKKAWCCHREQVGCPASTRTTSTFSTKTSTSQSATATSTSATTTTTSWFFNCSAGYDLWVEGWSDEKKVWCCQRERLGCPFTTLSTSTRTWTSATVSTSTATTQTATSSTLTTRTTSTSVITSTTSSSSRTTTGTSTSSTSSSSISLTTTSTISTTTTTTFLCRRVLAGVPLVDGACGETLQDLCLASSGHVPLEAQPCDSSAKLVCPTTSSVNSTATACSACSTLRMQDWAGRYKLTGEIRWGPSAFCQNESFDGYSVWAIDACGDKLESLGSVRKKDEEIPEMLECCHSSWYSLYMDDATLPEATVGFVLIASQGSKELLGPMLPLLQGIEAREISLPVDSQPVGAYVALAILGFIFLVVSAAAAWFCLKSRQSKEEDHPALWVAREPVAPEVPDDREDRPRPFEDRLKLQTGVDTSREARYAGGAVGPYGVHRGHLPHGDPGWAAEWMVELQLPDVGVDDGAP